MYQGHAGGLDVQTLWEIGQVATGACQPDLTFVLDMSPQIAAARIDRELDRMEQQGADFRQRLRDGFLKEAQRCPEKIVIIDAAQGVDEVQQLIQQAAGRFFNQRPSN